MAKSESFFNKNTLRNWKDCILALQSSEPVLPRAEKLHLVGKCLNALSMMVCTDPSLFGWPMMMYGSFQSPGGSILWNGINTGVEGSEVASRDRSGVVTATYLTCVSSASSPISNGYGMVASDGSSSIY